MITVLYTRLKGQMPATPYEDYLRMLPAGMQDKNRRFINWQDSHRHLCGWHLVLHGLQPFGYDHSILNHLVFNAQHRPSLPGTGVDFNISHSGNYIVCAIAQNQQLGIDVEEIAPVSFSDFTDVMSPAQWKLIREASHPMRAFFNFWTIKESVIKADGRGLQMALNDIIITETNARYENNMWHLHPLQIDEDYCACLASDKPVISLQVQQLDFYTSLHSSAYTWTKE